MADVYLLIDKDTGKHLWALKDTAIYQLSQEDPQFRLPEQSEISLALSGLKDSKGEANYVYRLTQYPEPKAGPNPKKILNLTSKMESAQKNLDYWGSEAQKFAEKVGATSIDFTTGAIDSSKPLTQEQQWQLEKIINAANKSAAQAGYSAAEIEGEKAKGPYGYNSAYYRPQDWVPPTVDISAPAGSGQTGRPTSSGAHLGHGGIRATGWYPDKQREGKAGFVSRDTYKGVR